MLYEITETYRDPYMLFYNKHVKRKYVLIEIRAALDGEKWRNGMVDDKHIYKLDLLGVLLAMILLIPIVLVPMKRNSNPRMYFVKWKLNYIG